MVIPTTMSLVSDLVYFKTNNSMIFTIIMLVSIAGYWLDGDRKNNGNRTKVFLDEKLNSGAIYRVWIEHFNSQLRKPLIKVDFDLSKVFLDEMYIGLCALMGQLIENHQILSWSFSNSEFT
ncbi:lectin-like protein [Quercus suber]|uniref:Lectin-like protein n=1 Tax=Quercus suber TaxID=58331 RepID=A0AAW0M1T0_QUESU